MIKVRTQCVGRVCQGDIFRDVEFFKLKILGIHETKHALVG